jgi:ribonuclease J
VIPHLVDHSSFSSFAFEIEGAGKRLFYSGDFREHGHIGKALDILYEKVAPGVDVLLMEGTMLGRSEGGVQSEEELSLAATEICDQSEKAVLVYQAGQNISRAVSFYKAARRTGRLFVLDVYMAHVMKELAHCPGGEKLPWPGHPGFRDVRVWYPRYLTNRLFRSNRDEIPLAFRKHKLTKEEMASDLGKVMLFARPAMQGDIRRIQGIEGSTLVYSLWEGYKAKDGTRQFLEELEGMGIAIETLHTSGHADLPALRRMVDTLDPKRTIPIHTFHPDKYEKQFGNSVQPVASGIEVDV